MRSHGGFSLLEILIALAILIVGVAAIVNVFPVGLHASKRAADFTSAAILAQEKMAELMYLGYNNWSSMDGDLTTIPDNTVGSTFPPASAPADGKNPFPEPDDGYKWFLYVDDVPSMIGTLAQATLLIYWNDRGNETYETFITYIANRN